MRAHLSPERPTDRQVASVRAFNRFWTARIGALDALHLASPYPLAAVRIIYELAHWRESAPTPPLARDLVERLRLDRGYLSRLLRALEKGGLVARAGDPDDARRVHLRLTARGRKLAATLEQRSSREIATLLGELPAPARERLADTFDQVRQTLEPGASMTPPSPAASGAARAPLAIASVAEPAARARGAGFILRPHTVGDMGWVIATHGEMYAREYGWSITFEALVARICADFLERFNPATDHCWIAERAGADGQGTGERLGCVFVVKHPDKPGVAKLRMLIVQPAARGLGLGRRLVREVIAFAEQAGMHTLTLWTNSILDAARHIYVSEGFTLVEEESHHSFGHDLVGQTWTRPLTPAPRRPAARRR